MVSRILSGPVHSQIDVDFSTSDPGVRKAIPNWGLDTNWASADNMKRGLGFLGTENVTLATNSGWAGNVQITAASKAVGAFPLTNPASKDSALLVTLPPGV